MKQLEPGSLTTAAGVSQVDLMRHWLSLLSAPERTAVLRQLIGDLDPTHLQYIVTYSNHRAEGNAVKLASRIKQANDIAFLAQLPVDAEHISQTAETLLAMLPLLRGNNANAGEEYMRIVAACVMHATLQGWVAGSSNSHFFVCRDLLIMCLGHPVFGQSATVKLKALQQSLIALMPRVHPESASSSQDGQIGSVARQPGGTASSGVDSGSASAAPTATHRRVPSEDLSASDATGESTTGSNGSKVKRKSSLQPRRAAPSLPPGATGNSAASGDASSQVADQPPGNIQPILSDTSGVFYNGGAADTDHVQTAQSGVGSDLEGSTSDNLPETFTDQEYMRVRQWLKSLRLHKYEGIFKNLTFFKMVNLTEDELEAMGVSAKGARSKLVKCLTTLKDKVDGLTKELAGLSEAVYQGKGAEVIVSLDDMLRLPLPRLHDMPEGEHFRDEFFRLVSDCFTASIVKHTQPASDPKFAASLKLLFGLLDSAVHNQIFTDQQRKRLAHWRMEVDKLVKRNPAVRAPSDRWSLPADVQHMGDSPSAQRQRRPKVMPERSRSRTTMKRPEQRRGSAQQEYFVHQLPHARSADNLEYVQSASPPMLGSVSPFNSSTNIAAPFINQSSQALFSDVASRAPPHPWGGAGPFPSGIPGQPFPQRDDNFHFQHYPAMADVLQQQHRPSGQGPSQPQPQAQQQQQQQPSIRVPGAHTSPTFSRADAGPSKAPMSFQQLSIDEQHESMDSLCLSMTAAALEDDEPSNASRRVSAQF